MKKTLLLSVVASTMIMAGGDIAPVEPVVAPAASAWKFSGQGVVYYQTIDQLDNLGTGDQDLFAQTSSAATAGIQLKATNSDVVAGIGAGFTVNGVSTLNLENFMVSDVMQGTGNAGDLDDLTDGGWIGEAYLTYGFGNTSIKAGRQTLPMTLSPFAFSEDWNVFQNTFDSVLVVNTDISNTALVYAFVAGGNYNSYGAVATANNMTDFNSINGSDGVHMLTIQNKSIADLTLTGTYYYGADHDAFGLGVIDDMQILWGDAAYNAGSFNVDVQGGQISHDVLVDDVTAFGARLGGKIGPVDASVAFSTVNDGGVGTFNIGGTTSALYTTTLADQLFSSALLNFDADKWLVKGKMDALGGNFCAAYANSDIAGVVDLDEFDLSYSTNITDNFGIAATYAYLNADANYGDLSADEDMNVVRVIANYKF